VGSCVSAAFDPNHELGHRLVEAGAGFTCRRIEEGSRGVPCPVKFLPTLDRELCRQGEFGEQLLEVSPPG